MRPALWDQLILHRPEVAERYAKLKAEFVAEFGPSEGQRIRIERIVVYEGNFEDVIQQVASSLPEGDGPFPTPVLKSIAQSAILGVKQAVQQDAQQATQEVPS